VNFLKGIRNISCTANDNIFVYSIFNSSCAPPITNSLSEPDAQYIMINNTAAAHNTSEAENKKIMKHSLLLKQWSPNYLISPISAKTTFMLPSTSP
jgi:hypothetical protein